MRQIKSTLRSFYRDTTTTENNFVGRMTFNMISENILLCKGFQANFTSENRVLEIERGRNNS